MIFVLKALSMIPVNFDSAAPNPDVTLKLVILTLPVILGRNMKLP